MEEKRAQKKCGFLQNLVPQTDLLFNWRAREFGISNPSINKEKLIEIIQALLNTEIELRFFLQLKESELETLVACIR